LPSTPSAILAIRKSTCTGSHSLPEIDSTDFLICMVLHLGTSEHQTNKVLFNPDKRPALIVFNSVESLGVQFQAPYFYHVIRNKPRLAPDELLLNTVDD